MSKKHPKTRNSTAAYASNSQEEEYHIIKHDLARVGLLNVLYLVLVLGLYYSNVRSHYLERAFSKILHF